MFGLNKDSQESRDAQVIGEIDKMAAVLILYIFSIFIIYLQQILK